MKVEDVDVNPDIFVQLLSVFPHISILDIGPMKFTTYYNFVPNVPPLGITVTQLTFREIVPSRVARLLTWLGRESGGCHPRIFKLLVQRALIDSDNSTMLHTIGADLQHLWLTRDDSLDWAPIMSLSFDNHDQSENGTVILIYFKAQEVQNPLPLIDLSHNANLTTIVLNCSFVKGKITRLLHHWIFSVLHTISSKDLRRLTIALCHLTTYDESNLDALDWAGIDHALAQVFSSHRNMEPVVFSMGAQQRRAEWAERATAAVLSRLPVLQAGQFPITVRCHDVGQNQEWPMFPVE